VGFGIFEIPIIVLLGFYGFVRMRRAAAPLHWILRFLGCAVCAWLSEESAIRFYGFYQYSPRWSVFLSNVPLAVIMVWPALIDSATALASQTVSRTGPVIRFVTAGIVLTDALLIETICTNGRLWSWNEPGIFTVPPIGILGWAYFAFFASFFYILPWPKHWGRILPWLWITVLTQVGTHGLLLASWWGLFKWVNFPLNPHAVVGIMWAASIGMLLLIVLRKPGRQIQKGTLMLRIPAAAYFYGVLWTTPQFSWLLAAFALAFIPPYVVLLTQSSSAIS
jgi:hypothetical protein